MMNPTYKCTPRHLSPAAPPTRSLPKLLPILLLALFFMMGGYGEVSGQINQNGHFIDTQLPYTPSGFSTAPFMLQQSSSTAAAKNTINDTNTGSSLFVNFTFDTTGNTAFLVYTTDGSAPTKTNGTVVSCSFSNFLNPDRTWVCDIPSSVNTANTEVNYVFYLGSNLDGAGNRVAGDSQYETSWIEGDNFFTYNVYSASKATGNFSNGTTWESESVPSSTFVEILNSHNVTLDQNASLSSLNINNGATFTASGATPRTLTIEDGGTLTNNGTFTDADGTVAFAGAGSITGTITFNNLDVSGAVDPGSAATVNGTLSLLSGGSVTTNSPAYGASSTLRYNTLATVNPGTEWPTGSTANPINVTIEGTNTQVSFGSDTSSRTIGGNLSIGAGATLQLSSAIGGDVEVAGNWDNAGTFDANGRAVFFNGTSAQSVTNAQSGGIEIDFLINDNTDNSTGLTFNDDLTVEQLTNNGILNLGTNNLTIQSTASANEITNTGTLTMNDNTVTFAGDGEIKGANAITMHNLEIAGGVTMTTSPNITNRFVINGGGFVNNASAESDLPDYGTDATLVYTSTFGVNDLASGWGTSGDKVPNNVAVEGSGTLTLNIGRSVSGEVNVGSGTTLNANGNLTVESGAFLLNDGTVNGAVNFEQLFSDPGPESTNPNDRWAAFAAPTSNALYAEGNPNSPTNEDRALLRKIWTQGFPGSNDDRESSTASVLIYDASANAGAGDYVAPSSNEITAGQGFFAFLFERKDRDDNTGAGDVDFSDPFATLGTINPNAFTFSTVEEGFNLLGNPLGVPIDWAASGTDTWTKTNLDEWMWLWDAANNQFELRSDAQPSLGSTIIAPFQPFLISANASPALSFDTGVRTTASNPNAGLFDGPERPFITLELEAGDKSSKTHFRFDEAYGESFTSKDAPFLTPLATNFAYTYSLKGNNAAMLNSLSDDAGVLEIAVAAGAYKQGNFYDGPASFTWPAFDHIPESWDIILQDSFTGAEVNLREDSSYEFVMSPGLNDLQRIESFRDLKREDSPAINPEFSGERFTLIIEQGTSTSTPINGELPAELALNQNYPNPFNPATQIAYALPEASEVRLEVFNVQGQHVATLIDGRQNAGTHSISFDAGNLSSGVYLYRLRAGNQVITRKMTLLK